MRGRSFDPLRRSFSEASKLRMTMANGVLLAQSTKIELPNPLTGTEQNASAVIGALFITLIKNVAVLVAIAAVVMVLYAGFSWLTAGGEKEKITKAQQTLVWVSLGLVVVGGAYAVLRFFLLALNRIFGVSV